MGHLSTDTWDAEVPPSRSNLSLEEGGTTPELRPRQPGGGGGGGGKGPGSHEGAWGSSAAPGHPVAQCPAAAEAALRRTRADRPSMRMSVGKHRFTKEIYLSPAYKASAPRPNAKPTNPPSK